MGWQCKRGVHGHCWHRKDFYKIEAVSDKAGRELLENMSEAEADKCFAHSEVNTDFHSIGPVDPDMLETTDLVKVTF